MIKEHLTADELIWMFHEKLAGSNLRHARIAIIPSGRWDWSALTNASQRRQFPKLASMVAGIETQLRDRYSLK
ncbi:hypothetical protein SAMN05216374_0469 [Tardiphaga sp. OK246]|jgi:hypothetical protein|uniref:hypothetical protein n=1 Tax=Tardiphaga sp. OK246 TaxID=1855307 RepID=UPI000B6D3C25|nr:hypothetical protein [Tardiphaga sp. OK246]SNS24419.1 hypothetical protein SAMN05216374_0469 [Tardiphaga sp. OK246]